MMAFEQPELSPRELATRFTDTNSYYVSESSVYRLLKAHDLIGSPAFIVIKAADEFKDKTTAPNQLWQTDLRPNHPSGTRKDQTRHHQTATIEPSVESRLNSNPNEPEPPSLNNSDCPKPSDDGQATQPAQQSREHAGNATDHRPSSNCLKAFTFDDGGLSSFIGAHNPARALTHKCHKRQEMPPR